MGNENCKFLIICPIPKWWELFGRQMDRDVMADLPQPVLDLLNHDYPILNSKGALFLPPKVADGIYTLSLNDRSQNSALDDLLDDLGISHIVPTTASPAQRHVKDIIVPNANPGTVKCLPQGLDLSKDAYASVDQNDLTSRELKPNSVMVLRYKHDAFVMCNLSKDKTVKLSMEEYWKATMELERGCGARRAGGVVDERGVVFGRFDVTTGFACADYS
ncbi:hypothetical protein BJ508DRAFT_314865 [Ascobolus immersus RN42]|uniref:Uncharacterized protein n=1 Tax=Ascobolus immersus RN42 TaxID=1160509 RepID=A0A3N4HDA4_ASCIM|nr:hypothetical protein BJ508DRAFT_314865 [Ascobolus immersus RN42]